MYTINSFLTKCFIYCWTNYFSYNECTSSTNHSSA